MESRPVQLDCRPSGVALLTVDRPSVRNALGWETMSAFAEAIEQAAALSDLQALIVTGAGNTFISGGDLTDLNDDTSEEAAYRQNALMGGALAALERMPVPTIAAIDGAARGGGCEVALACDLRVLAADATMGFFQIRMALTPGWDGAGRLLRLAGYARTMDLLVTGRVIGAEEALRLGLADRMAPPGKSLEAALELAETIAAGPPLAVRGVKTVLGAHLTQSRDEALARERAVFARLWASADHAEAAQAFLEKRPPHFKGQ